MMDDVLYIVIPAYNEEETIGQVVREWYQQLSHEGISPHSRMVVADSGSTDKTHANLIKLKKEYPQLEILSDSEKQHGPKLIALYNYAIQRHADYIFQTDSDGQTDSKEFIDFWKEREKYDAIFGNRVKRGDGNGRKFIEKILCLLLRAFFGIKVPDANAPFRLMKTELVERYLNRLPVDYNLTNVMITTYFVYYKEKAKFCKISFRTRQGGVNSINIPKIIKIGFMALGDF